MAICECFSRSGLDVFCSTDNNQMCIRDRCYIMWNKCYIIRNVLWVYWMFQWNPAVLCVHMWFSMHSLARLCQNPQWITLCFPSLLMHSMWNVLNFWLGIYTDIQRLSSSVIIGWLPSALAVSYTHLDVYKRQIHTQSMTKACDPAGEHQGKYCRRRVYLRDVGKCAQMSKSICVKVSV